MSRWVGICIMAYPKKGSRQIVRGLQKIFACHTDMFSHILPCRNSAKSVTFAAVKGQSTQFFTFLHKTTLVKAPCQTLCCKTVSEWDIMNQMLGDNTSPKQQRHAKRGNRQLSINHTYVYSQLFRSLFFCSYFTFYNRL